ncbi:IS3 family transposase, partial [Lactobacillus helveticus]|uniref:IS3 family transposase n=2 Tax=Lactobacillus helveticus TaxID=1587 RepID=UPI00207CDE58
RRNKRKYSSYKGTIGKIAPNLIHRDFFAPMPNMKWHTDITEFRLNGEKLYLSPILAGCGGDMVSYSISRHPDMDLVENFFGLLKTEMFYDQEYKYHSLQGLTQAIKEYIEYYNEERIKSRLKGLTAKEYRNQASINPVF